MVWVVPSNPALARKKLIFKLSTTGYPCVFSCLPNELVHYIFVLAAEASPDTARSLSAVSYWARTLVAPYLFCIIQVRGFDGFFKVTEATYNVDHILSYPASSPTISRSWINPTMHIKHLYFTSGGMCVGSRRLPSRLGCFWSLCGNLRQLVIQTDWFMYLLDTVPEAACFFSTDGPDLGVTFFGRLRYGEDSCALLSAEGPLASRHSLRRITEINLTQLAFSGPFELSPFPRLVRFSFFYRTTDPNTAEELLRSAISAKQLETILIIVSRRYGFYDQPQMLKDMIGRCRASDRRLHVLECEQSAAGYMSWRLWQDEIAKGLSLWERARYCTAKVYPSTPSPMHRRC